MSQLADLFNEYYWVSAHSEGEARSIVKNHMINIEGEPEDDVTPSVRHATVLKLDRSCQARYKDVVYEDGVEVVKEVSMHTIHLESEEPRVLSCSGWTVA